MSKEIYISSTPHETRLAIVENDALAEIYYERENEYTLAGSIYNGRVTRVLPGMQSSFVDIGLERDAFLYITDFMEEAGDSADFEASAGGDSGRGSRGGRNDRGDRGSDRGDRGGREQQPRLAEPSDSELFTQAVSGIDASARPVIEGERVDRGGDRGRRGGRNRGGNRSGNREGRPEGYRPEGNRVDEVKAVEPIAGNIAIPDNREEVGEGLPGADGSRRWRGRRGRRGGNRGPGGLPRTDGPQPVNGEETPRVSTTGPVYDAYPEASEEFEEPTEGADEVFEVAAAETLPTATEQAAFAERSGRPERSDGGFRGGRDRGGRDRGGRDGRGDRGGRERGAQGAPRVPRGFAPSTDLYKVDTGETRYGVEPEVEAPAEPIILPGESLSKYRKGEGGAEETAAASPANATPVVDTFVAEGWDGGFVLPGETLRPRTAPPAYRNDAPRGGDRDRDSRGRDGRDRDRGRGDRNDRGPREPRQEFSRPAAVVETVSAAETAEPSVAEPTYLNDPAHVPASHLVTPLDSTFVPPPPVPVDVAAVIAEPVAVEPAAVEPVAVEPMVAEPVEVISAVEVEPLEYEPEEASASYRVDPVAPSEFRQSAPVLDEPVVSEAEAPEAEVVHAVEVPAELVEQQFQTHEETAAETHELTEISDTGNMHSEPAAQSQHELREMEQAEPTSPIEHEGAVVEALPAEFAQAGQVPASAAKAPYFEPGSGYLEEEVLEDEEDGPVPTLHAHTAAEFEQQEQETLEGAADLGTMIREMSIDQITRNEPMDDEGEDEFEEDFLEEDQNFFSAEDEDDEDEVGEGDSPYAESEEEVGDVAETEGAFAEAEPRGEGSTYERPADAVREPRRDGRRDERGRGRRGDRERGRRPGSDRSSGGERGRSEGGRHGGDRGRQSMQSTNLPAISDLLKPGQEILVQIAKEPIAKKGARITSHIALPGRFLVFMPTVSHTGVSRKIESDGERRRLKEILLSEKGDAQGGFIVRTAAAGASEEELRSDLRFLLNLWSDIKTRSESSKSPALIYHDLNLIERVLRDQVTDNFSAIWVDSETEYERVLRFLQRFQPSLIRRVKLYTKETPLFEQFGITEEINKALRSKVWLKSGGSIVINQTEALVAIDINTGKFVGKTARLEDTIVKTNLDAIPEIVRQIRLRDLGGIIIIDFIDMDERKNRNKVMAALEEELKSDRAPSKVLQFNDFGLVAITRKRVKQSLERTLSTTCGVCQGTGMVKSPVTVCNDIYIEMRKMAKHLDRGDVMLRVHPDVVKQLKAPSTHWLQEMEEMCGKTILVKSDPSLHPEQFDIH
jgi:ribonuclease E